MRVGNFALFCAVLLLSAGALAGAQENQSRNFRLQFYSEYCNCDDECGIFSSCLSASTEPFIKNLNSKSYDLIAEAQRAGFKGICSEVTIDKEIAIYSMTPECYPENPEETAEKEQENAPAEQDDAQAMLSSSSRVITLTFNGDDETSKTQKTSSDNGITGKTVSSKKITGGQNMDLITAGIISGTIVLVGFFGLMAWMAYLLQKKNSERTEKIPKK